MNQFLKKRKDVLLAQRALKQRVHACTCVCIYVFVCVSVQCVHHLAACAQETYLHAASF